MVGRMTKKSNLVENTAPKIIGRISQQATFADCQFELIKKGIFSAREIPVGFRGREHPDFYPPPIRPASDTHKRKPAI